MLSRPRKPPLEEVVALGVLAVDPPGEVEQQLLEHVGQEGPVAPPVDQVHHRRGPGVHRGVDVVEGPLVGREGPVGVHEPLPADGDQLVLGEGGVDVGQGDGVEGQVPGGEPGVLPGVGHGEDVGGVEVAPGGVAPPPALGGRGRLPRVAGQPAGDVVGVVLLGPEHPGEGLAQHPRLLGRGVRRGEGGVEGVRLGLPLAEQGVRGRAPPGPASRIAPRRVRGGAARRRVSRRRNSTVAPGATSAVYHQAALVPRWAGLTVGAPATTWSLMPSLG